MNQKSFSLNGEMIRLDDACRASLPGSFIKLSRGYTHYELGGPEDGVPVVLINGFSIPMYLWDHTFPALVKAGYRVLRFDFYGRGYSDRPDTNYGPDLLDLQIVELLQALKIDSPINLIGCSMGGIISTIFCDRHPEKVHKLVLIDPAGLMPDLSPLLNAMKVPLLGEIIIHLFGHRFLLPGMAGDLLNPAAFPEYVSQYAPQMQIKGFKRAILSTLRSGVLQHQEAVYRRVGKHKRKTLLIWGTHDQTIPFAVSEKVRALLPDARFYPIHDAGHVPHYELAGVVNPILINFLGDIPDCVIENRNY